MCTCKWHWLSGRNGKKKITVFSRPSSQINQLKGELEKVQCEHNELFIKHEKVCGDYARLQEHNKHQKQQLENQGSQVSELQNQLKHVQDRLEKQEQAAFAQAGGMFVSGFSGNTIFNTLWMWCLVDSSSMLLVCYISILLMLTLALM